MREGGTACLQQKVDTGLLYKCFNCLLSSFDFVQQGGFSSSTLVHVFLIDYRLTTACTTKTRAWPQKNMITNDF